MALGEAWIDVHANLRPFLRDAAKAVRDAAAKMESTLKEALDAMARNSRSTGEKVGQGLGDGFRRKLGDKNKSPWINITGALAGALDDGISALPAEIKAAIVLGITAALPIVGGALTGALVAATGAGIAVIGLALASQFESVQQVAQARLSVVRRELVGAAVAFEGAAIAALDRIAEETTRLAPRIRRIFDESANFVGPLLEGILAAFDFITESIANVIDDIQPFIDDAAAGIAIIGSAAGEALEILVSTGEDGQAALRDLIAVISGLIIYSAQLLAALTEIYGTIRNIVQATPDWLLLFSGAGLIFKGTTTEIDRMTTETGELIHTNLDLRDSTGAVITLTKEEEKALKELEKSLQDARDAAFDAARSQIDLERSLDNVAEALRRNGRTLDIEEEKGRRNQEAIIAAIEKAQAAALNKFRTQELTAVQATQFYNKEIEQLRQIAAQGGITKKQFDLIFARLIELNGLPITPETEGLRELRLAALRAAEQLERTLRAARQLRNSGVRMPWGGGFQEFADGDIVNRPTFAMVGEAGPEVVIPLTKPARAAQLAQQSGLTQLLGGGPTTVMVFVGNEQLDSRMYRIVESNNRTQGLALSQGFRGL